MGPIQVFGSRELAWQNRRRINFCARCGGKCQARIGHDSPLEWDVCTSCGNRHFVDPVPFVAVVVLREDRVLLCKRAASLGFGGLWCLPSGHIDINEDFITAGWRETEEETGVQVEIKGLLGVVNNFWDGGGSTVGIILLAGPIGGEPHPTEESEAVGWFSPDELPELAWEADRAIIRQAFMAGAVALPVDPHFVQRGAVVGWTPPPASTHAVGGDASAAHSENHG